MAQSQPDLVWRRESTEDGPDLILFKTRYDWMRNPLTQNVLRRLVLESVDWVNVVAMTPEGLVVMVEQFRFGTGKMTLEPPGGMVDAGETSLQAAQRELAEETGYTGGHWRYLGAVEPNPAYHNHHCHHWLAEGVEQTHAPVLDDGEAIHVRLMQEADIRQALTDDSLRGVLPLSALSRVFDLWPRPFIS